MANLLEKASILITPTAYDNGSINAIKPKESPFGDLDFTRGSAATRVNSEGLVENVQILSSELVTNGDFSTDSDWTLGDGWNIDQENNKATCDGTQTAATILEQTLGTGLQNDLVKFSFTLSDYSAGNLNVSLAGTGGTDFVNLNQNGNYSLNLTSTDVSQSIAFQGDADFIGSVTNISVKQVTEDTDLARIDYLGGEAHWLIEPQSTNLITYSEDFSQWNAINGITVTQNDTISPDDTSNATRLDFNPSNTTSRVEVQIPSGVAGDFIFSIWAKSVSGNDVSFGMELGSASAPEEQRVATSEWKRFYRVGTTTSAVNLYPQIEAWTTNNESIYIWGAQLEQKSYATSYIPTNGSTVTRAEDLANNSGNSDLINSTEGVLYAEIAALADDLTNRVISLSDGTSNERVVLQYHNTTNLIRCFIKSGGSFYATLDKVVSDTTDFHKIAYKYKSGETKLFVDGSLITSSSNTFSITGLDVLQFANGTPTASPFYGKTKCIAVFKEALTDSELTCLTT